MDAVASVDGSALVVAADGSEDPPSEGSPDDAPDVPEEASAPLDAPDVDAGELEGSPAGEPTPPVPPACADPAPAPGVEPPPGAATAVTVVMAAPLTASAAMADTPISRLLIPDRPDAMTHLRDP
ncbi:hypothetical protein [Acidipropionibacterium acidipropionici]|nr:hypothetical protein [Acidipropionibacterium acidipropionici]ALN14946.1 hypothetical protein ASQ49_06255 [Acidipropionibacterium acidipropionici]APZ09302.1 hypothetical protein BWX38_08670 [Acidipropionibacterium acidipropionici]